MKVHNNIVKEKAGKMERIHQTVNRLKKKLYHFFPVDCELMVMETVSN